MPAPLPRTVLVGTGQDCRDASDAGDEAIVNGFTIAGTIDIDEIQGLSVEGIRRQLVSAGADTLLLCGQLDDETFATVVRAAMMAECSVLATARRLALPGIEPKVLWRRGRPFIEMRAVACAGSSCSSSACSTWCSPPCCSSASRRSCWA